MKDILIAPSILTANFGNINAEIASIENYSDLLHLDIMDGNFVPNLTFGPTFVSKLKTKLPLDCHLMVIHPETYLVDFKKAGANILTVHAEACTHLHRVLSQIKDLGMKAGVALNPHTPLASIEHVINLVDLLLIMTVNPGFGGQTFIEEILPKIAEARKRWPDLDIEIDGGINEETAKKVINAGANILVSGNYIFSAENREKAINSLSQK